MLGFLDTTSVRAAEQIFRAVIVVLASSCKQRLKARGVQHTEPCMTSTSRILRKYGPRVIFVDPTVLWLGIIRRLTYWKDRLNTEKQAFEVSHVRFVHEAMYSCTRRKEGIVSCSNNETRLKIDFGYQSTPGAYSHSHVCTSNDVRFYRGSGRALRSRRHIHVRKFHRLTASCLTKTLNEYKYSCAPGMQYNGLCMHRIELGNNNNIKMTHWGKERSFDLISSA